MARNEHENVISALRAAKTTFPQLRVGQLIDNARHHWNEKEGHQNDLFYLPDENLARAIFSYIAAHARRDK